MVGNGRVQRQVNRAFMISSTLSTKGGGPNLRRGFRGAPPDQRAAKDHETRNDHQRLRGKSL
jgi:hypothetical protein